MVILGLVEANNFVIADVVVVVVIVVVVVVIVVAVIDGPRTL